MPNIHFSFRRGAGDVPEILYGKVEIKPTLAFARGTSLVLPAPTTLDLVNGEATANNVYPTSAPVAGEVEWAYRVKAIDTRGQSFEWMVGVPDSTGTVEFTSLPRYFETKPPLFGKGEKGDPGEAAKITVGTVTGGATASVTNTGTNQNAVLDFVLPKGDKGDRGDGVPAGGSALQYIRKDASGAVTEWATLDKASVGLSNVNNTADADKPVSAAQSTAIANATSLPNYSKVASDAPSAYPNGLSSVLGRVTDGWPQTNPSEQFVNVVTSKPRSTPGATAQWCYPFYAVTSQRPMYRVSRTDDTWTEWREIAYKSDVTDNSNYVNVKSFGAVADGVTDDTSSISAAFAEGRSKGLPVYIPSGRYFIDGSLDISGLTVYGDYKGYYNRSGSTLIGNGTNTVLNQASTTLDSITMNISNLRIENAGVGLRVTYSIFSKFQHISVIDASGIGIIVGEVGIIGPIWNIFEQCQASSTTTHALSLGGTDWNNNNIFYNCDFKGIKAVKIQVAGGYGAINNIFRDTEIRGTSTGLFLAGLTQGTKVESCYLECHGPAIEIDATCRDLLLFHNIYGSLKNNNVYGQPCYVYHSSGVAHVKVYGGWVTTGATSEYQNLSFVGSGAPASLRLHIIDLPTVTSQASGWTMYAGSVQPQPREVTELKVAKSATPKISLEYPDGSRVFDIRRNGSQGGADYGVYFRNEGVNAFVIDNAGRTLFQEDIGSSKIIAATSVTNVKGVLPIRSSTGAVSGYIPIYSSYS